MGSPPRSIDMKRSWIPPAEQWSLCSSFTNRKLVVGVCVFTSVVTLALILGLGLGLTLRHHRSSSLSFYDNYNVSWSGDHIQLLDRGLIANVLLDNSSGGEFGSKKLYLYGHLSMQIKLVGNDSAGTVTAFYMASQDKPTRDEFDFEFLGNRSGQPYALQTNIYVNGTGGREQRILLWFDPSTDYHSYSVLWNQHQVIFFVDDTPVRVFRNSSGIGVGYAYKQPMRILGSMWNGEDWATVGGIEKTNWSLAPFVASFRGFAINGCDRSVEDCLAGRNWWDGEKHRYLEVDQLDKLSWVKKNYMIYDYCTDTKRYSPVPVECGANP